MLPDPGPDALDTEPENIGVTQAELRFVTQADIVLHGKILRMRIVPLFNRDQGVE